MDKIHLEQAPYKYLRIEIDPLEANTAYSNMLGLLMFIGEQNATRRADYPLGIAYKIIRQKVDKKFGYSWKNRKRRTSKAEIRSLAFAQKRFTGSPVMKIPYKSYQLMEAIIECVEELDKRGVQLHSDYRSFYGQLYGQVFMKKQIEKTEEEYKKFKNDWIENEATELYLYEDFSDADGPFHMVIKGRDNHD